MTVVLKMLVVLSLILYISIKFSIVNLNVDSLAAQCPIQCNKFNYSDVSLSNPYYPFIASLICGYDFGTECIECRSGKFKGDRPIIRSDLFPFSLYVLEKASSLKSPSHTLNYSNFESCFLNTPLDQLLNFDSKSNINKYKFSKALVLFWLQIKKINNKDLTNNDVLFLNRLPCSISQHTEINTIDPSELSLLNKLAGSSLKAESYKKLLKKGVISPREGGRLYLQAIVNGQEFNEFTCRLLKISNEIMHKQESM